MIRLRLATFLTIVTVLSLVAGIATCAAQANSSRPFHVWLQELGFAKDDPGKPDRGEVRTVQVDFRDKREIALFVLVRWRAAVEDLRDLFLHPERLAAAEDVSHVHRLSTPPRVEDFADLIVEAEGVASLRTCRVGDCMVELSVTMIDTLRDHIPWSTPEASVLAAGLYRSIPTEYASRYETNGSPAMITYADRPAPQSLSRNPGELLQRTPSLLRDLQRFAGGHDPLLLHAWPWSGMGPRRESDTVAGPRS